MLHTRIHAVFICVAEVRKKDDLSYRGYHCAAIRGTKSYLLKLFKVVCICNLGVTFAKEYSSNLTLGFT